MYKLLSKAGGVFGIAVHYGCLSHCFFEYCSDFVTCSGPSMEPTLYTNNVLMTERISKRFKNFDRGDIVISKSPNEPQQFICKRIVGLPGDKVEMKPKINFNPFESTKSIVTYEIVIDDLNVDKQKLMLKDAELEQFDEIYDKSTHINNQESSSRTFRSKSIYVPKGHVWLEGDNSQESSDSRNYGPVPMGLIQSRVFCRIWPFSEFTVF